MELNWDSMDLRKRKKERPNTENEEEKKTQ